MSGDFAARLSRWSQRKLAARRGVAVDEEPETTARSHTVAPGVPLPQETPQAQGAEQVQAARRQMAADDAPQPPHRETPALTPVEELTTDSDFTQFMAENVPKAIQRAALRKLWRSDPVFANLDGLNDYDEDYTISDTLASAIRTSYQVGKGYIDDLEAVSAEGETPGGERTRRAEAPEAPGSPAESASPAASADAADAPGLQEVRQNAAVEGETPAAPQPMDETELAQAQGRSAGDKG